MTDVIVIGAGAAGMMAAITAASNGAKVLLIEKNKEFGLKIGITGKGRCNLTNNCTLNEFMENVPTNPRFLYRALTDFSPEDTMEFFASRGIPLKTERGRRVFPESDNAQDIRHCLRREAEKSCKCVRDTVRELLTENGAVVGVRCANKTYYSSNVIIATGGMSYPRTGSTGDGYRLASAVGHTIVTPCGSLVPLVCAGRTCRDLMGLSLRNIGVKFVRDGKTIYSDEGELLFTHFGVSGPTILSASAVIGKNYPVTMHIDLKPALDHETLDKRLLRDIGENKNKIYSNLLSGLLPSKMIPVFVSLSEIDANKKANEITKEERKRICETLKNLSFTVTGTRPVEEAIVTSGGVSVKEINPSTMESRLVKGLYFAGEVIDVDAYTGGYNLQIAFSTGHLAGESVY